MMFVLLRWAIYYLNLHRYYFLGARLDTVGCVQYTIEFNFWR